MAQLFLIFIAKSRNGSINIAGTGAVKDYAKIGGSRVVGTLIGSIFIKPYKLYGKSYLKPGISEIHERICIDS